MDYNQFPLYPYATDPLRILSPRRIQQELPAAPPEPASPPEPPPPESIDDPPRGGGSGIPDAAYWPVRNAQPKNPILPELVSGRGTAPRSGVVEGDGATAAASAISSSGEDPTTTAPAAPRSPSPSELGEDQAPEPESPEAERIRLMRTWLNTHWDLVEAMARAGEAPQRPPPPEPPEPASAHPEPASAHPEPVEGPRVHVARADRWSKWKMAEFLRRLAATHSVTLAAQAVGMSRQSAYRLRARLKGMPFDVGWEAAFRHGYDNLAHAALDRALNGVEVPHYHEGKRVGTTRKYDERLTVALLAMRNRQGAPLMGRYGAAAEYFGERWDLLLERVETGSVRWDDEHRALGPDGLAQLGVSDEGKVVEALIDKHAPEDTPRRR